MSKQTDLVVKGGFGGGFEADAGQYIWELYGKLEIRLTAPLHYYYRCSFTVHRP